MVLLHVVTLEFWDSRCTHSGSWFLNPTLGHTKNTQQVNLDRAFQPIFQLLGAKLQDHLLTTLSWSSPQASLVFPVPSLLLLASYSTVHTGSANKNTLNGVANLILTMAQLVPAFLLQTSLPGLPIL